MTYNLHDLTTASCKQLCVCLSRVVFMLQRYKWLQVLPADGGNSSGRIFNPVMWFPRLPKIYLYTTELHVVRLPFNFTVRTFMKTVNFKVPLKSCKNIGASVGGLYSLTVVTRENCQILPLKCQQEFLECLQLYRCIASKTALM
jgi:hypothetical protein